VKELDDKLDEFYLKNEDKISKLIKFFKISIVT
jgi:hypothetical protein